MTLFLTWRSHESWTGMQQHGIYSGPACKNVGRWGGLWTCLNITCDVYDRQLRSGSGHKHAQFPGENQTFTNNGLYLLVMHNGFKLIHFTQLVRIYSKCLPRLDADHGKGIKLSDCLLSRRAPFSSTWSNLSRTEHGRKTQQRRRFRIKSKLWEGVPWTSNGFG